MVLVLGLVFVVVSRSRGVARSRHRHRRVVDVDVDVDIDLRVGVGVEAARERLREYLPKPPQQNREQCGEEVWKGRGRWTLGLELEQGQISAKRSSLGLVISRSTTTTVTDSKEIGAWRERGAGVGLSLRVENRAHTQ